MIKTWSLRQVRNTRALRVADRLSCEACGYRRTIDCLVTVGAPLVRALMDLVWVGSHSRGTRIKLNEFVVWVAPLEGLATLLDRL